MSSFSKSQSIKFEFEVRYALSNNSGIQFPHGDMNTLLVCELVHVAEVFNVDSGIMNYQKKKKIIIKG